MKAPSKSVECKGNSTLTTIIELHDEINTTSAHLKVLKENFKSQTDTLKEESKEIFDADLGAIFEDSIPIICGNHEYHVDDRVITVNYKMAAGGLSFTKIGGYPAKEVLTKLTGSEKVYKKLFTDIVKVQYTEDDLELVAATRPDLIGYNLNEEALPEAALTLIKEKWPAAFTPYIKDEEEYIAEVSYCDTEVEVHTSTGLLSKLGSLDDEIKYNLRDFIRKVLASIVTSAVKCGNKADA